MTASAPDLSRPEFRDIDRLQLVVDAMKAERSLADYARLMWPVIEPGNRFLQGWVVDCLCEHLEAVSRGEIKRLVVNVPPGTMKSLTFGVLWPSWEWGPRDNPALRYVSASYSQDLTIRDNRRGRILIQSDVYQKFWGSRFFLVGDQNAKVKYENNFGGFRLATSIEGVGTGERGNRVVIDDPHSVRQVESDAIRNAALQWFAEVVPTRLRNPVSDPILAIMQRTHGSDVTGLILSRELKYEWLCLPMEFERKNRSYTTVPRQGVPPVKARRVWVEGEAIPQWVEESEEIPKGVQLPLPELREVTPQDRRTEEGELLWPERFPREYLEGTLKPELRSWGGTYAEAGQLQQRPAPRGGGMFQREDFKVVDRMPEGTGSTVRGWDLAASEENMAASWTVGVKMKRCGSVLCILDVVRFQGSPNRVFSTIKATAAQDGLSVFVSLPQDPGQAGKSQVSHMAANLAGYLTHFSPETGEKSVRARGLAAEAEAGNLYLLRGPWNAAFIGEAIQFPAGTADDQVDAASRAYARLLKVREPEVEVGPIIIDGRGDFAAS